MGVPAPASTPKKRKKEERAGLEGFLASEDEFTSGASEDDFSESEGAGEQVVLKSRPVLEVLTSSR